MRYILSDIDTLSMTDSLEFFIYKIHNAHTQNDINLCCDFVKITKHFHANSIRFLRFSHFIRVSPQSSGSRLFPTSYPIPLLLNLCIIPRYGRSMIYTANIVRNVHYLLFRKVQACKWFRRSRLLSR